MLSAPEMLKKGLQIRTDDEACYSIPETYEAARLFTEKLALFFTHTFPSADSNYQTALDEILDSAVLGFHAMGGAAEPRAQLAKFLANGVMSATFALTCFSVSQVQGGVPVVWEPWTHGGLSEWAEWGASPLTFEPAFTPTAEQRYAIRGMLQHRLLRYHDMVGIHRAGIDLQSLELF